MILENSREIGATIMVLMLATFCLVSWLKRLMTEKRKKKIMEEGVAATARVLQIVPTGVYLNNLPEFQVRVQIQQQSGGDFVARTTEVLPYARYDAIRKNQQVTVKYDRTSCKHVILCDTEFSEREGRKPFAPISQA